MPQQTNPVRPLGEMVFLMDSLNAIRDAVIAIWKDVTDETKAALATAQANWIIQSLWVEYTVIPWLMQQDVQADVRRPVRRSLAAVARPKLAVWMRDEFWREVVNQPLPFGQLDGLRQSAVRGSLKVIPS